MSQTLASVKHTEYSTACVVSTIKTVVKRKGSLISGNT